MVKRVFLFLITNFAIVTTISIILSVLGVRAGGGLLNQAIFCLIWGMGASFVSLQLSRWMAKRSMGVQLVDGNTGNADADWLYRTVERLSQQANLPMPEVGIYDSPEVNAFATGPSKRRSLVAVSTGILRSMNKNELEAVLAHEVSHIGNGDMVTMTLLQGVVNAFVMFVARLVANVVASSVKSERGARAAYHVTLMVVQMVLGVAGMMVTSWFSRMREFRADAGAAALSGRENMVAALQRLQGSAQLVDPSTPALASFKIAGVGRNLFSTHPPLEDRIAALRNA